MSGYLDIINNLKTDISKLEEISKLEISGDARSLLGEILIKKMVLTSNSILTLLPDNDFNQKWDFPSIATLVRNIIENYNIFFYLSIEEVSSEEVFFRILLCEFHSEVEKLKMYFSLKVNENSISKQKEIISKLKNDIKQDPFFLTFDSNKQYYLLKGSKPFYLSHNEITKRHKLDVKDEDIDFIYRYISNFLHTSPFSLESKSDEKPESIDEILFLMDKYIKQATNDYTKLIKS